MKRPKEEKKKCIFEGIMVGNELRIPIVDLFVRNAINKTLNEIEKSINEVWMNAVYNQESKAWIIEKKHWDKFIQSIKKLREK